MFDSVRPHRRQPTRLPHPWDSPGKNTGVGCHFLLQCMKVKRESEVAQSRPTLSDPMDCSLPSSSVHGIFQARVLEWGAIAFSAWQQQQLPKASKHNSTQHTWPPERELQLIEPSVQRPPLSDSKAPRKQEEGSRTRKASLAAWRGH